MTPDILSALKYFESTGFIVLKPKHKNANGADLIIIKNNEAFKIEIKQAEYKKNKTWQVQPIQKNRMKDDFVLIMHKEIIVEIIAMEDHLKLCSKKGYRPMTQRMKLII